MSRDSVPWAVGRWRELPSAWMTGRQTQSDKSPDGGSGLCASMGCGQIPPSIAAHAIASYSWPGAVVVDPDCGCGVVLIEALRAGRHAVGMTTDHGCWQVARASLTTTKRTGAWPDGAVLDASANRSLKVRSAGLDRRADLVLTGIRPPAAIGSPSPDSDFESEIQAKVRMWTSLLRPGGHAVAILGSHRSPDGTLLDLATVVLGAAVSSGLVPVDRCIALTGDSRGDRVARRQVVDGSATGVPVALVAHRTALVLRAPELGELVNEQVAVPRAFVRRRHEPAVRGDVA